ncbi:CDP-archaeol synthase [Patescibacteria group bacterium]|nr:CDP-archaeol synthase [Patescibacteria group bacterium]
MDWIFILQCLYFFLPAYSANMTPTFAKKGKVFKFLAKPVDFGKKYQGFPVFGHHKTWRGIILGVLIGILVALLQRFLWQFPFFEKLSFLNYQEINVFFLGFLLSFGALSGDLISSFFKRRQKIESGKSWIPFDQISFVIGSFLLVSPFFEVQISAWLIILFLSFLLHIIVNRIGFWLKISDSKM